MQFTQSWRECELLIVEALSSDIYRPAEPVYGGDFDAIDAAVAIAREEGFKAVWLDEGAGQPDSVYLFSVGGIKRVIQRPQ